jgi:hypothetical protein
MNPRIAIISAFLTVLLVTANPLSGQETADRGLTGRQPVYWHAPQLNLQYGTAFQPGGVYGPVFSHSLAPAFNWDVGRRFSLTAGTIFSTASMNGPNPFFPYTPHMAGGEAASLQDHGHFLGTTVYVRGAYQVNPRLTLVGGAWTGRNNMEPPVVQMNARAFDTNPGGMVFGFDYRVSDSFRFGAEVNVSRGNNPFNPYSPYGYGPFMGGPHSMFASPAPFHRSPRW